MKKVTVFYHKTLEKEIMADGQKWSWCLHHALALVNLSTETVILGKFLPRFYMPFSVFHDVVAISASKGLDAALDKVRLQTSRAVATLRPDQGIKMNVKFIAKNGNTLLSMDGGVSVNGIKGLVVTAVSDQLISEAGFFTDRKRTRVLIGRQHSDND